MYSHKIDYLSFTIPVWKKDSYLDFLVADVIWLDRGYRGYKEGGLLSKGGMVGMTLGRDDFHFDISGKVLNGYLCTVEKLYELLGMIISDGGNISRIDYAYDVCDVLLFETVLDSVRSGEMVTKSRSLAIYESFANDSGLQSNKGGSIYIGSRKSAKYVRIYDKAKESGSDGFHVRFEIQLRDEVAMISVENLLAAGLSRYGSIVGGMLLSFVDFRLNDSEKISERTRCSWYADMMQSVDRVGLVVELKETDIEDIVKWLDKQVAPSLALVKQYYGDSFDSVLEFLLESGRSRMSEKHLNKLGK